MLKTTALTSDGSTAANTFNARASGDMCGAGKGFMDISGVSLL
jgi:hypothetical protein